MTTCYTIRNILVTIGAAGIMLCGCMRSTHQDMPLPDTDNGGLMLPPGFTALKVVDELGPARHLEVCELPVL